MPARVTKFGANSGDTTLISQTLGPGSTKKPFSYSRPICFILPDDARTARSAHASGRHGHCEHWDHSRKGGPSRGRVAG